MSMQLFTEPEYRTGFLWRICLVAAMGGFLFGYDWVVIGGAKPFYEVYFGISESSFDQGLAMSTALIGCLLGAFFSGVLSDRFGRKRLLILAGLLFSVSALATALAQGFLSFNLARVVGGIGIGLSSNLSPMYIAEISPANMRGRLVSINQLTIVIGILAAQLTNWLIAQEVPAEATAVHILESWNGQVGWRWMFAAETPAALSFILLMFFVPESPRWLVKSGQSELARSILCRVGGTRYAETGITDIQHTLSQEEIGRVRFSDLLEPQVTGVLLLGIGLAVLQQWCGINVIFNYAQEIFAAAGFDVSGIMQAIVLTGIVNMAFTIAALYTVDRWGRRKLMLLGTAGLAMIYMLLGFAYSAGSQGIHVVILIVLAIACYAMTLAPVTWVVISEIFPNRIRGAAMSVAIFALWAACTILTFTFPYLNRGLGPHGTFWLYSAICIAGFFFVWLRLPETKNKTLEEIETRLSDRP